jgi:hypothetical protein
MLNLVWRKFGMKKKLKDSKRVRMTIDLDPEDDKILGGIMASDSRTKARMARKALRILASIQKGEAYLTTPAGQRIPNSVIFS